MIRSLRLIGTDTKGATLIEFAIVAPVMSLAILGLMDLSYQGYIKAALQGAMQKASRDSTLETGPSSTAAIDAQVKAAVDLIVTDATYTYTRRSYAAFKDVGDPEKYTDSNSNNIYDVGECFEDVNGNGQWDNDLGRTGQGGPDDIVYYNINVAYPRLFPMASLLGWSSTQEISATTVVRNQPYGEQALPVYVRCS